MKSIYPNVEKVNNNLKAEEWNRKYAEYTQTDQWHEKCMRVRIRDKYLCQGCLNGLALHVVHSHYDFPLGREPLFILYSVCKLCYEAFHDIYDEAVADE